MAWFDVGSGLAAAGEAVAKTAGAMSIETLRSQLEEQRVKLASDLAAERESQGRAESHGYAMQQQQARQDFEAPLRDAQIEQARSSTSIANAKEARTVGAGRALNDALDGGTGGNTSSSYRDRVAQWESGGKDVPNAQGSGAQGKYQIMPTTWADLRKQDPSLPEDITKATPEQQRAAFDRLTSNNSAALQKAGIEANPANLYLAHRFGAEGARAVIKADENVPLANVLPADWQKQNQDMQGQTAGTFRRLAEDRMKGVSMDGGSQSSGASGDMPADLRRIIAAVGQTDAEKAGALAAAWYGREREISARDRDTDKQIAARREEQDKALAAQERGAAKLTIGDDGVGYYTNATTKKAEVAMIDGQPLKFRDPDVARAQTELIRSVTTQLSDLSRSYVPQITAAEATVRKLQADPMRSADRGMQRDFEQSQAELKALRERFDSERLPLIQQLNRIGAQLTGKAGLTGPSATPNGAPPLSDFLRRPGSPLDTGPL